jgi:hypothetical protein
MNDDVKKAAYLILSNAATIEESGLIKLVSALVTLERERVIANWFGDFHGRVVAAGDELDVSMFNGERNPNMEERWVAIESVEAGIVTMDDDWGRLQLKSRTTRAATKASNAPKKDACDQYFDALSASPPGLINEDASGPLVRAARSWRSAKQLVSQPSCDALKATAVGHDDAPDGGPPPGEARQVFPPLAGDFWEKKYMIGAVFAWKDGDGVRIASHPSVLSTSTRTSSAASTSTRRRSARPSASPSVTPAAPSSSGTKRNEPSHRESPGAAAAHVERLPVHGARQDRRRRSTDPRRLLRRMGDASSRWHVPRARQRR